MCCCWRSKRCYHSPCREERSTCWSWVWSLFVWSMTGLPRIRTFKFNLVGKNWIFMVILVRKKFNKGSDIRCEASDLITKALSRAQNTELSHTSNSTQTPHTYGCFFFFTHKGRAKEGIITEWDSLPGQEREKNNEPKILEKNHRFFSEANEAKKTHTWG